MMEQRIDFKGAARRALADEHLSRALHDSTLARVARRKAAWVSLPDVDALRDQAHRIKMETLDRLDHYLDRFVAAARGKGAVVHHASTGEQACLIIAGIARAAGSKLCVKSKTMAGEEIELNAALEAAGLEVVETDLGEFIIQLDHDHPSHIITPIIHKTRYDVGRSFAEKLGVPYTHDPTELSHIARRHLREKFRRCDLGISGVNFGVAETGTICLCTNEGNGRVTVTRPRVHVALMGIEKLVPRMADLAVFLKLLAKSGTGQPITVYTTLLNGPRSPDERDGPEELHIVLLDAGRRRILDSPFRESLACIRCGACLNACPVYRNVGGHAYQSVYPGPIGKVITPLLKGEDAYCELPQASSLCGACLDACPVKIDLPAMLVQARKGQVERRAYPWLKRGILRLIFGAMSRPRTYAWGQRFLRWGLRMASNDGWVGAAAIGGGWTATRDIPAPPEQSFRDLWKERLSGDEAPVDRKSKSRGHEQEIPTTPVSGHGAKSSLIETFCERAAAAGAVVGVLRRDELSRWAQAIVSQQDIKRCCRQGSLPAMNLLGIEQVEVQKADDLFEVDMAITDIEAAVAETGSIVCCGDRDRFRGGSLIPRVHLAVVRPEQIVAELDDVFASPKLAASRRNVNIITGPSKTADIEGVLVTGVHGPEHLYIAIVSD